MKKIITKLSFNQLSLVHCDIKPTSHLSQNKPFYACYNATNLKNKSIFLRSLYNKFENKICGCGLETAKLRQEFPWIKYTNPFF